MSATAHTTGPTVTGTLLESKADSIVLALPGTDYRLHLAIRAPLPAPLNKPVHGIIHARAKRVDKVPSGGRFVEPVYGRPRRVQGRVTAIDAGAKTITVHAAATIVAELAMPEQRADDFQVHDLVSFDVERGAWFGPV